MEYNSIPYHFHCAKNFFHPKSVFDFPIGLSILAFVPVNTISPYKIHESRVKLDNLVYPG